MKYAPTFVNAGNPQLTLLAGFLATMMSTNEEATRRVFDGLTIRADAAGGIVVKNRHGQSDIWIEEAETPEPESPGRIAMIEAVFKAVTEVR